MIRPSWEPGRDIDPHSNSDIPAGPSQTRENSIGGAGRAPQEFISGLSTPKQSERLIFSCDSQQQLFGLRIFAGFSYLTSVFAITFRFHGLGSGYDAPLSGKATQWRQQPPVAVAE
jgi:hypothetical protein